MLLTMLSSSRTLVKEMFIHNRGLFILDRWLLKTETEKLIPQILKLLAQLPVDFKCLKDNGSIGKTVNTLASTSKDRKIKKQAKILLRSWKKLVDMSIKQNNKVAKKRKELQGKKEPPKKEFCLQPFPINHVPQRSPVKKNSIPSTLQRREVPPASIPLRERNSPAYKPLTRLLDPPTPVFNTLSRPRASQPPSTLTPSRKPITTAKDAPTIPPRDNSNFYRPEKSYTPSYMKPGSSCILDPSKKKYTSKKSLSWAPNPSLVRVRYFPRDKTLLDNPNLRAVKARLAQMPPRPIQHPMVPRISWKTPVPIRLPSYVNVDLGSESIEIFAQKQRERGVIKVQYPNHRAIPMSPANDNTHDIPLPDEEIPFIPFNSSQLLEGIPPARNLSSNPPITEINAVTKKDNTSSSPRPEPKISSQVIFEALQSGKITADFVKDIMNNPTAENIQLLEEFI